MVTLIALIASLFAGASAGIIGVASVAIRREERDFTLTSEPTGNITRAGRKLNGVYVRCPLSRRHPPVMTPAYRSLVRLRDDQDFYRGQGASGDGAVAAGGGGCLVNCQPAPDGVSNDARKRL